MRETSRKKEFLWGGRWVEGWRRRTPSSTIQILTVLCGGGRCAQRLRTCVRSTVAMTALGGSLGCAGRGGHLSLPPPLASIEAHGEKESDITFRPRAPQRSPGGARTAAGSLVDADSNKKNCWNHSRVDGAGRQAFHLLVNSTGMLCESGCFFRQGGGAGWGAGTHGRRVALGAAGGAWYEGVCIRRHFLGRRARAAGCPAGVPCSEGPLQVELRPCACHFLQFDGQFFF
jgi:hypothetical protein